MDDATKRTVPDTRNPIGSGEGETATNTETLRAIRNRELEALTEAETERDLLAELGRTGKQFGWSRVSTGKQTATTQDELLTARVPDITIYTDTISGAKVDQSKMFDELKLELEVERAPVLNVWRVDRLGRDALHLISFARWLTDELDGVLVAHDQGIRISKTSDSTSWFRFELEAVLAAREMRDIQDRTRVRIAHKKKHLEPLGRKSKVNDKKLGRMLRMKAEGYNYTQIGEEVGLSRTAVANHIKQALAEPHD